MPDFETVSPVMSSDTSAPRNWTWIWNCGSNDAQYQDATATQYRPSNVNVSIRISSPGDNGPVHQANVAVAVGASRVTGTTPPVLVAPATGSTIPVAGTASASGSSALDAAAPEIATLPVAVTLTTSGLTVTTPTITLAAPSAVALVDSSDDVLDLPHVLAPLLGVLEAHTRDGLTPFAALRGRPPRLPFTPASPLGLGARAAPTGPMAATAGQTPAAVDGEAASGVPRAQPRKKPTPRWRPPQPQPPTPVQSGASIVPATGGGSSGGGIPIFLALPFLAAMLDLARRVTLDGVALPSGHRSRMPDDPG